MMMMSALYKINTLNWIFIVLFHWNSPRVDMSYHSDISARFRANQSVFLLLNVACLAKKQQTCDVTFQSDSISIAAPDSDWQGHFFSDKTTAYEVNRLVRNVSSSGYWRSFHIFWNAVWNSKWPADWTIYFITSFTEKLCRNVIFNWYSKPKNTLSNIFYIFRTFRLKINFPSLSPIENILFQLNHHMGLITYSIYIYFLMLNKER